MRGANPIKLKFNEILDIIQKVTDNRDKYLIEVGKDRHERYHVHNISTSKMELTTTGEI